MTKQSKKPTLANKEKTSDRKQEEVCQKGPVPNFAKNHEHTAARAQHLACEAAAAKARERLKELADLEAKERPELVVGIPGLYCISGENSHGRLVSLGFTVRLHRLPAKHGIPCKDILVIEEPIPRCDTRDKVYIFHDWLFKQPNNINFTKGQIGDVQAAMLAFLQHNLSKEINSLKAYRAEQYLAQNASASHPVNGVASMQSFDADTAANDALTPPTPTSLAGVDFSSMNNVDQEHALAA